MKIWHIKSHNILLSGNAENTISLQFNGIWIKFVEEGKTLKIQAHKCSFIDTVTARGEQGRIKTGETTRSDRRISKVFGKLEARESANKHESFANLSFVQGLFPRGVLNFNNLIYNIKSYNKAHFEDGGNYYNDRKGMGKKDLDRAFTLGSTGPLLGGVFSEASASVKAFSYIGLGIDFAGLFSDISFSNLYENLVKVSTNKPVVIVDFDKEDDSLKDSAEHVIRAFSAKIIEKRDEKITEENILQTMWHSVSDYLEGYTKRAKSIQ
ncbi:hypothetical protein ASE74_23840 [Pedobacter sp. Leaf216]|uniref:hypothetical protein n=1 Tax=Pedobacter sp. Leaf216 TaxID=1735684 RepID=UPI0006FE1943|nr:hypothetical protein [Pedobacter sp. Leaf216]KQM68953.1 hypothetical protein ASE74_23840 [Pedobacter sp. Leaf216]